MSLLHTHRHDDDSDGANTDYAPDIECCECGRKGHCCCDCPVFCEDYDRQVALLRSLGRWQEDEQEV
jgi:hypothetical protein